MYKLRIYHDVKVIEDSDTGELVLKRNAIESALGISVGHSIVELDDVITSPKIRGLYPNNEYLDESARINDARNYQVNHPNEKAFHLKEIHLTKEQYENALNEMNKYEKYVNDVIPKEILGGMWRILGNNCSDFTNTIYRAIGLPSNFTYQYTTQELAKIPGVLELYINRFGSGDKEHIVIGDSIENIAARYNIDESLVSEAKTDNMPLDQDAQSMKELGAKYFVIAPNSNLLNYTVLSDQDSGALELNKTINKKLQTSIVNSSLPEVQNALDKIEDSEHQISEAEDKLEDVVDILPMSKDRGF